MWSEWMVAGEVWQECLFVVLGLSAGLSVASGVFTVFTAVGLVPRFAEHTKTGNDIVTYENMIILGCFLGCIYSLFNGHWEGLGLLHGGRAGIGAVCAAILLSVAGGFAGIYVGTLAISIAELLDAIPIMTHRIKIKKGVSWVITGLAVGKLMGSLFYYLYGVYGW